MNGGHAPVYKNFANRAHRSLLPLLADWAQDSHGDML